MPNTFAGTKKKYEANFYSWPIGLNSEFIGAHQKAVSYEYNKERNIILKDCSNRCRNLIFPFILHQAKTDQNGHYEFKQLPYGKYYVSAQSFENWWLVPVYINKNEIKMNLSPRNAFLLDTL